MVYQSSGSLTGEIRLQERRTNGTNHVGLAAPQSVAADVVWTLPAADGASGQALTTNGSGVLSWVTPGGLPVADTTNIVTGSSDATKLLRFEVDGFTTATTRTLTPQNASYTLAGTDLAQTFTATQTFNNVVNLNNGFSTDSNVILTSTRNLSNIAAVAQNWIPDTNNTRTSGSSAIRWSTVYGVSLDFSGGGSIGDNLTLNGSTNTMSGTLRPGFDGLGGIGSSSYKYGAVYAYDAYLAGVLSMGGTTVINTSRQLVGLASVAQNITFSSNSTYNIGSSTVYPLNIWANYIEPKTQLVMGAGTSFQGSLIPSANNLYSIGDTTWRLSTVVTTNANISGVITAPNGNTGWSGTRTIRDSAGTGTCTLVFSAGILTGGTC